MNRHLPRARALLRWRNVRWALAATTVPVALWACNSHPLEAPKPRPETQTDIYYDVNPIRKIDLLFMIDNSTSMKEEQENLARNFPAFMDELAKIPGGLPDVRIAVVNSDMGAGVSRVGTCHPLGDTGKFQTRNPMMACGLDPAVAHWLADDGKGNKNFTGELGAVFQCIAKQGTEGCGLEHQLQSIRAALAGKMVNPENHGFIRDDAYLGIVILTDEDDCSADPEAELFANDIPGQAYSLRCNLTGHTCDGEAVTATNGYMKPLKTCTSFKRNPNDKKNKLINVDEIVSFVKSLKAPRTDRIIVSAVMGWSGADGAQYKLGTVERGEGPVLDVLPICQTRDGEAAPAVRIHEFVEAFAPNRSIHSICQTDLKEAMTEIGKLVAAKLANTCISDPLIDTDMQKPGVQPDCQVTDRVPKGSGFEDDPLPACGSGGMPCWKVVADPMCGGSGFKVEVDRGGKMAPAGTQQAIKCLTCTSPPPKDDNRCVTAM